MNLLARWLDSDVGYSFRKSPTAIVAAVVALICVIATVFAAWVAPHNPFDLTTLELSDARLPPAWIDAYVASGEPMDKAGAYAIQGDAARHVRRIDGSHSGIMGLPLYETSRLLRGAGQTPR